MHRERARARVSISERFDCCGERRINFHRDFKRAARFIPHLPLQQSCLLINLTVLDVCSAPKEISDRSVNEQTHTLRHNKFALIFMYSTHSAFSVTFIYYPVLILQFVYYLFRYKNPRCVSSGLTDRSLFLSLSLLRLIFPRRILYLLYNIRLVFREICAFLASFTIDYFIVSIVNRRVRDVIRFTTMYLKSLNRRERLSFGI